MALDIVALQSRFAAAFPGAGAADFCASAPGRVNLIGEHTDYNEGFVCPMAIDRRTVILGAARTDAVVRLHSFLNGETAEFRIDREVPKDGPAWALYARGVAEALRRRGKITRGLDAVVDSDVPIGGGLSSSASFEVGTAMALLRANGQTLPPVELALACQWAEHEYPGVPCGIMDQFISVMGTAGHALLIDCREQNATQVPLDDPEVRIVICNSGVRHALAGGAGGEYAVRRRQCEMADAELQKDHAGVRALRDASEEILEISHPHMEDVIYRRARHIITENRRTTDFAGALSRRNYAACGELMYASHASMRDDYEISCRELDGLVEIARTVPGVIGARMTGGGFGGCMVALVREAAAGALAAAIDTHYPKLFPGRSATTFATVASDGAIAGPADRY